MSTSAHSMSCGAPNSASTRRARSATNLTRDSSMAASAVRSWWMTSADDPPVRRRRTRRESLADPGDGVNHDTATFASHRVGRERDPGRGGCTMGCTSTASRGG